MLTQTAPICSTGLQIGAWCEGDGECGTQAHVNNCPGGFDVYLRVPVSCVDTHVTCPAMKRMFDDAGYDCYNTDVGAVTNSSYVGLHLQVMPRPAGGSNAAADQIVSRCHPHRSRTMYGAAADRTFCIQSDDYSAKLHHSDRLVGTGAN